MLPARPVGCRRKECFCCTSQNVRLTRDDMTSSLGRDRRESAESGKEGKGRGERRAAARGDVGPRGECGPGPMLRQEHFDDKTHEYELNVH
jgi:hypothetical protein